MTREEKERAADALLGRYERLGATVVNDDQALCRLLRTLVLSEDDGQAPAFLRLLLSV